MSSSKFILAFIVALLAANAFSQEKQKSNTIYIIEGLFFNEIPIEHSKLNGMMSLKTANGTSAFGLSNKEPLPDDAKEYAIPQEKIPEAEILLEMFNEQKSRFTRFSVKTKELLKVGDEFPRFTAKDIDGKTWSTADVAGKVMVLNCWFTGCGPCRAEMPELSKWKDEMPDVMFFSSTYEKPTTARPVLESTGFNWIPLVNDTQFKEYVGVNGYPMTIVIGKDGRIALIEYGTSPLQRKRLKETIESLR